jgi:iron complex transport system substrate-binding protein
LSRIRRTARILLPLFAVLLLLIAACSDDSDADDPAPSPTGATAAFPYEVPRSDGKTLRVEAPVQRIVSLSPGATEIIYAIGAQDALVAVDNNADYPPEVSSLSGRVDAFEPNVEAIAAFDPDLVIVATDINGLVGALDRLNIPLYYVDLDAQVKTIDDVLAQVDQLGRITGHADEAAALNSRLRARLDALDSRLADIAAGAGPSVYHELDLTFYSVAEGTFIGNIYTRLRMRNIAGDGGGVAYPQLTQEKIIADNPDVIVLADEEFGVSIDSVKSRPGWDAIAAVRDGRIYTVDPDIISRPGPRIVDALEQIARQVYPERFP